MRISVYMSPRGTELVTVKKGDYFDGNYDFTFRNYITDEIETNELNRSEIKFELNGYIYLGNFEE